MGAYKYIKESFQQQYKERSQEMRTRIITWNTEPTLKTIEKPTNIARARELGYKDKQGVVIVRARIRKGLSKRVKVDGGRKPSKSGRYFSRKKSGQAIAEERTSRAHSNCEVLNSYYVGEDGKSKYFEVILLDRSHASVLNDPVLSSAINSRGRAYRGLTASGRRHRGMMSRDNTRMATSVRQNERSK
ncbi:MAG TPA: 50S ribosomal protein L15e [Candidatus Saccharimonadales bacterium]|nr:50S ribosomal protein L15e [Candidatus Saccharimonadales bacterium]